MYVLFYLWGGTTPSCAQDFWLCTQGISSGGIDGATFGVRDQIHTCKKKPVINPSISYKVMTFKKVREGIMIV